MGNDQHAASRLGQILTRRRLLSLSGVGVAGALAGCSGGGDTNESGTTTTEPEPTETTPETTEPPTQETTAEATPEQTTEIDLGAPDNADIVVDAKGRSDFETVQSGIDAIPDSSDETIVYITAGTYKEKLTLPEGKSNVTFLGAGPEKTILTYDDKANDTDENGNELGTKGSASFSMHADGFTARDLTFRNSIKPAPQAVAILVDGAKPVFENCRFVGAQDTLYTYSDHTRQYYHNCYIKGRADFIFGAATAWFQDCEIRCFGSGSVTAAKTPEDVDYGYVFQNCEISGELSMGSYLGRPWGPHAKTLFRECHLGEAINPDGWHAWDGREETCWYAEYDNEGPGYTPDERVDWAHILGDQEATAYTYEKVFTDWDPRQRLSSA